MTLITLDKASNLTIDVNVVSTPTIDNNKIIVYLDGDIYQANQTDDNATNSSSSMLNRTLANLTFNTSEKISDYSIKVAPSVLNQFKNGFINTLNSRNETDQSVLDLSCLSEDIFRPIFMQNKFKTTFQDS